MGERKDLPLNKGAQEETIMLGLSLHLARHFE